MLPLRRSSPAIHRSPRRRADTCDIPVEVCGTRRRHRAGAAARWRPGRVRGCAGAWRPSRSVSRPQARHAWSPRACDGRNRLRWNSSTQRGCGAVVLDTRIGHRGCCSRGRKGARAARARISRGPPGARPSEPNRHRDRRRVGHRVDDASGRAGGTTAPTVARGRGRSRWRSRDVRRARGVRRRGHLRENA